MKKMTLALAMFGALSLSACAHGGHHHSCCGGDECKMDSSKKSCCHDCCGDECKMKDSKTAPAAAAGATEKAPEKK